jgi:hypothetical protein
MSINTVYAEGIGARTAKKLACALNIDHRISKASLYLFVDVPRHAIVSKVPYSV